MFHLFFVPNNSEARMKENFTGVLGYIVIPRSTYQPGSNQTKTQYFTPVNYNRWHASTVAKKIISFFCYGVLFISKIKLSLCCG